MVLRAKEFVPPRIQSRLTIKLSTSCLPTAGRYGRQAPDGRLLFGGDRRVHPTQPLSGGHHPLPRLVPDMHGEVHAHATAAVPALKGLAVEQAWSGVMPFSADGDPVIGRVSCSRGGRGSGGGGACAVATDAAAPGLWCVSGLGGSGFMRGGMAGCLLAHAMHGSIAASGAGSSGKSAMKEAATRLLEPADPARFLLSHARQDARHAGKQEQEGRGKAVGQSHALLNTRCWM